MTDLMVGPGAVQRKRRSVVVHDIDERSSVQHRRADVGIGCVFGVLGSSNLVQGAWTEHLPWLNVTAAAFLAAPVIALSGLRRRIPMIAIAAMLILLAALALGLVQPAVSAVAEAKRVNLFVGVVVVTVASVLSLTNERRLRAFLGTLVALALVAVAGQWLNPDSVALLTGRRTPEGLNAIGVGRLIGVALAIVVARGVRGGRPSRVLVLAVPLAAGLVAAGSRGPLLGTVAALAVIVILHPDLRFRVKIAITGLGVLAGYVLQAKLAIAGSRLSDLSGTGRSRLYEAGGEIALEHPVGVGWGNFYRYVPPGLLDSSQGEKLYVHNILLEFLIEAGLLGGLLFIAFVGCVTVCATTQVRSLTGLAMTALAVNLLVGALLSSDVVGNRMLWVVCAALLAGGVVHSSRRSVRPPARRSPGRPSR